MDHQLIVNLTNDEYATLLSQAQEIGEPVEVLSHELLARLLSEAKRVGKPVYDLLSPRTRPRSPSQKGIREVLESLYNEGFFVSIPTGEPLSEEEEAERKRLGELFGQGKPMSEIVIEDRGSY